MCLLLASGFAPLLAPDCSRASEQSENFLLPFLASMSHSPRSTDELPAPAGVRLGAPAYAWEVFTPVELSSTPYNKMLRIPVWLRVLASVPASNGWNVNFLAYTLYIDKWTTTYGAPYESSRTRHEAGRGDAGVQVTFTHDLTERWSAGFGARLQGPTAGPGILANTADAELGSGRWQIMPWASLRASLPELSEGAFFAPTMRWTQSFGGDVERRRINEPQIRPTFQMDLSKKWFMTLYPTYAIRINFGGPVPGQTGRLFLPIDGMIGYRLTDTMQISLQAATPIVKQYPVFNLFTMLWFRGSF
jgi:hypothetical protein